MNIPVGPPPAKAPVATGAAEGGVKARMAGMAIPMMMPGQGPPPKKAAAPVEEQPKEEPEESPATVDEKQKKLNKHNRARHSTLVHRDSRQKYDVLPDDEHLKKYLALVNLDSDETTANSTPQPDVAPEADEKQDVEVSGMFSLNFFKLFFLFSIIFGVSLFCFRNNVHLQVYESPQFQTKVLPLLAQGHKKSIELLGFDFIERWF